MTAACVPGDDTCEPDAKPLPCDVGPFSLISLLVTEECARRRLSSSRSPTFDSISPLLNTHPPSPNSSTSYVFFFVFFLHDYVSLTRTHTPSFTRFASERERVLYVCVCVRPHTELPLSLPSLSEAQKLNGSVDRSKTSKRERERGLTQNPIRK